MKLLIPLSYLTEACNLSQNIDEKAFKIHLKRAQSNLKDVLGYNFYEEISDQYDPNSDTFTAANATLYEDYIKDYLAWRTYFLYLGFSQSQSTPTGQRQFEDENSTVLEDVKLWSFEKNVKEYANFYKYELINYMRLQQENDSTAFPLWVDNCSTEISFAISSIKRDSTKDNIITIDKSITSNE